MAFCVADTSAAGKSKEEHGINLSGQYFKVLLVLYEILRWKKAIKHKSFLMWKRFEYSQLNVSFMACRVVIKKTSVQFCKHFAAILHKQKWGWKQTAIRQKRSTYVLTSYWSPLELFYISCSKEKHTSLVQRRSSVPLGTIGRHH